jgi:hypothetical protein
MDNTNTNPLFGKAVALSVRAAILHHQAQYTSSVRAHNRAYTAHFSAKKAFDDAIDAGFVFGEINEEVAKVLANTNMDAMIEDANASAYANASSMNEETQKDATKSFFQTPLMRPARIGQGFPRSNNGEPFEMPSEPATALATANNANNQ